MLHGTAQTSSSTSATRLVGGRETARMALAEQSLLLYHHLTPFAFVLYVNLS